MEGGLFRLSENSKGVCSAYAKLARGFLPRMQTMKGGFFRPAVFSEGGFFRRGFLPYTPARSTHSTCLRDAIREGNDRRDTPPGRLHQPAVGPRRVL
ncbi:hypothetical protein DPMN_171205 [Dreissena polymorpha]|uniref:Uncharacterized protein n=1 Tax=Dreissena polymorpha TaxID=45954 RepID=A0A9D4IDY5_DREPO|nr:hypothetical protein DPMN_171205 [Dreissena polymorpha]